MVWDAAWRANLPWAGASTAFASIATIEPEVLQMSTVDMPALMPRTAAMMEGGWLIARKEIDSIAAAAMPVFEVSGAVAVAGCFGVITTDIVHTSVIEGKLGTETTDTEFIAATADIRATADNIWYTNATPAETEQDLDIPGARTWVIADEADIIFTSDKAPDTSGAIEFYCWWKPLSEDADVSPAV